MITGCQAHIPLRYDFASSPGFGSPATRHATRQYPNRSLIARRSIPAWWQTLRIDEIATPEPGPGQVRVRLRAAALNRRDVWITLGQYPGIRLPCILGSDGAGTVDARQASEAVRRGDRQRLAAKPEGPEEE